MNTTRSFAWEALAAGLGGLQIEPPHFEVFQPSAHVEIGFDSASRRENDTRIQITALHSGPFAVVIGTSPGRRVKLVGMVL